MKLGPALYIGKVSHQRLLPTLHRFAYPLAMVMFDIDELEHTVAQSRWWSLERFNLISFCRRDYLGRHNGDLKTSVQEQIFKQHGERFDGKVYLLTQPRYLGFVFNPVSFYFCVDHQERLTYVLADINNTPWNQRHCYALQAIPGDDNRLEARFDKAFHISPFMPMDIQYQWRFSVDDNAVDVHMQLYHRQTKQFSADMSLQARPLTANAMAKLPWQFPLQTLRIVSRIYWQALRLWLKRVPFYSHPETIESSSLSSRDSQYEDNR